ncbi:MAG TPA: sulfatase-like hydrolase/transferase [Acidimicrobiia bacterium]|nr:sulfatase-like hydrolase/transferase [Acidimicrobiia bacterium]
MRPSQYLVIVVAATHQALATLGANYWQTAHPERVILVAALSAAVACGLAWFLVRLGARPSMALFVVVVGTVVFVRGGPLWVIRGPIVTWLFVGVIAILVLLLGRRLPESAVWIACVALVVALASGSLMGAIDTYRSMGLSHVVATSDIAAELRSRPDIYLVVLDAYAGRQALASQFGETKGELVAYLESRDFQVPDSAWSSQASTDLSLPTIVDMAYPVDPSNVNDATRRDLYEIIGGENNTVSLLEANGYKTTMVESGWVGSECGDAYDTCIPSHWLDEVLFDVAWNSLVNPLVMETYGHAFTTNALATMDAVVRAVEDDGGDEPRFVFAHVLAPHPPFFLDESCRLTVDETRIRWSISPGQVDPVRDALFLQQTSCVDGFLTRLADAAGGDDVVVVVGDHGTRRLDPPVEGQRPEQDALVELMNVLVAVRTGADCTISDPILTSDLMRQVLNCFSSEQLDPVPHRMFARGGYEMTSEEIAELMGSVSQSTLKSIGPTVSPADTRRAG